MVTFRIVETVHVDSLQANCVLRKLCHGRLRVLGLQYDLLVVITPKSQKCFGGDGGLTRSFGGS